MLRRSTPASNPAPDSLVGIACGVGAFTVWGFVVVYFKQVAHVPSLTIIAHRAIWCLPLLGTLILISGGRPRLLALLGNRATVRLIPVTALLLATNWLLFVYCTNTNRITQASLAYYIAPLMMTGLGVLVRGERLRGLEIVSIALASIGVIVMSWAAGEVQWMPLVIAGSWSLYSLIRGSWKIPSVEGLGTELLLMSPFAITWLIWTGFTPADSPHPVAYDIPLLAAGGLISTVPLVLFGLSVTRVRLSTLGLMQYVAPTLQLLLGVLLYREPFGPWRATALSFIWAGLAVFTWSSIRRTRATRAARRSEEFAAERQGSVAQAVE